MSLLDDVSIVVTPNGYKAGTLYGVIPSSGAADMDVTRATAATRVDENGLVNYAEVLGSELVTCGDFECAVPTDSWIEGTGWLINGGKANASGTSTPMTQTVDGFIAGKTYKVSFEVTSVTQGYVRVYAYVGASGTFTNIFSSTQLETGIYEGVFEFGGTNKALRFYGSTGSSGSFIGSIDNVSVKQVDRDNVPRIDYTGGGCPHILAEPQRTNTVTYSQDTSQWTDSGMTYSVDYIISPDGTSNGSKAIINDTITSSNTRPMTSVAVTSGTNYVFSVFGKADEFDMINLDFSNSAFSTVSVDYNLTNGTVTSFVGSPVSQGVEDYGNGWYRCYVVATAIATTTTALIIRLDDNPTGDGTSGLYLWGAQFEAGSYPTSYIPTSGSTVTRNQDQFTRDGISSLINSTEGVLFAEMSALANDGTFRIISLSDGTGSNRLWLYFTVGSNLIQVFDGTTIMAHTIDVTNMIKVAAVFDSNGTRMWVNGSQVGSNSYVGFSGFDRLNFSSESGSNNFFGKIKQVQVYDTALTDNQLIQLTGEAGTHFFESYSEMAETLTYTIQ